MVCDPLGQSKRTFRGSIASAKIGEVRLAVVSTSPVHVRRRRCDIARIGEAPYLIKFQLSGEAYWSQRGKDVHLRTGDFVICSTAEPYTLRFERPYQMPVLAIAERTMKHLTPHPEQFLGRRMAREDASCSLLCGFVSQVVSKLSVLPERMVERAETNILDLLGGVLSVHSDNTATNRQMPEQLLKNMKGFIASNLRNQRLGPAMVAETYGVSIRYLHKLFASEELTLTKHIRMCRVEACRKALANPAMSDVSITDIALHWGFYDLPHMTNSFREAYGETPRSYRLKVRENTD